MTQERSTSSAARLRRGLRAMSPTQGTHRGKLAAMGLIWLIGVGLPFAVLLYHQPLKDWLAVGWGLGGLATWVLIHPEHGHPALGTRRWEEPLGDSFRRVFDLFMCVFWFPVLWACVIPLALWRLSRGRRFAVRANRAALLERELRKVRP